MPLCDFRCWISEVTSFGLVRNTGEEGVMLRSQAELECNRMRGSIKLCTLPSKLSVTPNTYMHRRTTLIRQAVVHVQSVWKDDGTRQDLLHAEAGP